MKRIPFVILALAFGGSVLITSLGARSGHANKDKHLLSGTVVSINETTIVVKTKKGASDTVTISPSTTVIHGTTARTIDDVRPGDRVRISLTSDGDRLVAAVIDVRPAKGSAEKSKGK